MELQNYQKKYKIGSQKNLKEQVLAEEIITTFKNLKGIVLGYPRIMKMIKEIGYQDLNDNFRSAMRRDWDATMSMRKGRFINLHKLSYERIKWNI